MTEMGRKERRIESERRRGGRSDGDTGEEHKHMGKNVTKVTKISFNNQLLRFHTNRYL